MKNNYSRTETSHPLVVSVIIYSGRRSDIVECLDSLDQMTYPNHKIMVMDYILSDGLSTAISSSHPDVQVVELSENLGYAGNNNVGIKLAMEQGADWILILNDDTILDAICLSELISNGESIANVGIVGPMIYHFDEPIVIQSAGGELNRYWSSRHIGQNEPDEGQYTDVRQVDWVSGCAMLVRRGLIEQVGMLDPDYFLYWEETEWCLRAGRAGWKTVNVPKSRLWHKGVQSDYQPKPYVTYYMTRNHLFTLFKYKAPPIAWIYTLIQIIRSLVSWTIKPKWRSKREHRNAMWRGFVDFLRCRQGSMTSYTRD